MIKRAPWLLPFMLASTLVACGYSEIRHEDWNSLPVNPFTGGSSNVISGGSSGGTGRGSTDAPSAAGTGRITCATDDDCDCEQECVRTAGALTGLCSLRSTLTCAGNVDCGPFLTCRRQTRHGGTQLCGFSECLPL